MSNPLISIVMPVRNEGERVKSAILSFARGRSNAFPLEFVIVDDASEDGCCDDLELLFNSPANGITVTVIKLLSWTGIPQARNIGGFSAKAPLLLITDANVKAGKGWDRPVFREIRPNLALCAAIADMNSAWTGFGCLLDLPGMGIRWINNPAVFNNYVPIAPCTGTVIHKKLFRNLGGYDAAMPVYGAAEPEFSIRLWLYGARIKCVPDLVIYHRFRPAAERQPFLEKIHQLQIANYLRFGLLYLNEKLAQEMLDYWGQVDKPDFYQAYVRLDRNEIDDRRQYLQRHLKHDLDWLTGVFRLADAS